MRAATVKPGDGRCFFNNILNITNINSFVIYRHNQYRNKLKPINRLDFMLKLSDQLTASWQKVRLALPNISRELRSTIGKIINQVVEEVVEPALKRKGDRTYCSQCDYRKRRMTTTYCASCNKPICGEHQKKICVNF